MKRLAAWILLANLTRAYSVGEEPRPAWMLFALPKIAPRQAAELQQNRDEKLGSSDGKRTEVTEDLSLSTERAAVPLETSLQVFQSMNGEPALRRVELPDEPAGAIGWIETRIWDPVFAPEVIRVGKVQMTGGIIAAAKRKNPFCLLNPLIFAASW